MNKKSLAKAANILNEIGDWYSITGKTMSGRTLSNDIISIFSNIETQDIAITVYTGFYQSLQEEKSASLQDMIVKVLMTLNAELSEETASIENKISAYVIGAIAGTKAAIEIYDQTFIESPKKQNVSLNRILESIDWEMNKSDISNAYAYMDRMPDHPSQNAIGFETTIHEIPSTVICYFYSSLFRERLSAITIMIYESPPDPKVLENTYEKIYSEIVDKYGKPEMDVNGLDVWLQSGKVLCAGTTTGIIGLRFGNPKFDLTSAATIGIQSSY